MILNTLKKEDKELIPHFDDLKTEHKIRLRFYYDKQKYEQKKGYKKIGYDKAKQELETWFNDKIIELKHNNNFNNIIEIDELDNDKIWISLN